MPVVNPEVLAQPLKSTVNPCLTLWLEIRVRIPVVQAFWGQKVACCSAWWHRLTWRPWFEPCDASWPLSHESSYWLIMLSSSSYWLPLTPVPWKRKQKRRAHHRLCQIQLLIQLLQQLHRSKESLLLVPCIISMNLSKPSVILARIWSILLG